MNGKFLTGLVRNVFAGQGQEKSRTLLQIFLGRRGVWKGQEDTELDFSLEQSLGEPRPGTGKVRPLRPWGAWPGLGAWP
jgi:hypothetical protein